MPLKPCEICGRVEMITGSGKYCRTCRAERKNKWARDYYANHWKELREKARKIYAEKKEKSDKKYAKQERPKIYPVSFINKGGRYSWEVRFKNPLTKRTVLWQSDGDFDSLRNAQKDFRKACGGGR